MTNNAKYQEILLKGLENLNTAELKQHLNQTAVELYAHVPKNLAESKTLQEMINYLIKLLGRSHTTKITVAALIKMNQTQLSLQVQDDLKKGGFFPSVSYEQGLPEGLKDQAVINIHGQPTETADRFEINIYKGKDIAFHFNPRFDEDGKKVIVRNSRVDGVWQKEERTLQSFPFTRGKPFEMKIVCTCSEFIVDVDNKHLLNFTHRMKDIENFTKLTIEGDVQVNHVFTGELNPKVPYEQVLPEGLKNQTLVTVHGQPKENADGFYINFRKGDDVPFHFNPRFNYEGKQMIVRNSKVNGVWQEEEREIPYFPFVCGKPFEIKMLCTSSEFIVDVDKEHFLNFKHRMMDIENFTMLTIFGDVDVNDVLTGIYGIC